MKFDINAYLKLYDNYTKLCKGLINGDIIVIDAQNISVFDSVMIKDRLEKELALKQ